MWPFAGYLFMFTIYFGRIRFTNRPIFAKSS